MSDAIEYIRGLISKGRKVGIFSCEDPYNTPFHKDLYKLTDYLFFVPKVAGIIVPESLDLGLQAKGINAWGVFGHYGNIHGHQVCAAIAALKNGYDNVGPDFKKFLDSLSNRYKYNPKISLKENVVDWTRNQHESLLKLIPEKQRTVKGAVQGDIIVFAGLVENSHNAKSYKAEILFSNVKNHRS